MSRITIKQALTALVDDGIVYRIQGKGTFVSLESNGEPVVFAAGGDAVRAGTNLIAYLCPRLHNAYMATLLNEIEGLVEDKGYHLIFVRTHEDQETEKVKLREMRKLGVRGMIIYPVDGESHNEEILRLHLESFPIVVIDRYLRGIETNRVFSDNIFGAFQATDYLLTLGHRNIAIVSSISSGTTSIEDRLAGYEKAFAERSLQVNPDHCLFTLSTSDEENKAVITDYLKTHPEITAVLAVNSTLGLQVVASSYELGRRIPEDLSVVFFDLSEKLSFKPTYIQQRGEDLAREGVRLLLDSIDDPRTKGVKVELPTRLVEGASAAALAGAEAVLGSGGLKSP